MLINGVYVRRRMRDAIIPATPSRLFNTLCTELGVSCYGDLSRTLEFSCAYISGIMTKKLPISEAMILAIYDKTGWSIEHIRSLAGINVVSIKSAKER